MWELFFYFHCFFDAIAFLTAWVPFFAAPERLHHRI
jgi:hypothetical protein